MRLHIDLDTNEASSVAQLANLASALSGRTVTSPLEKPAEAPKANKATKAETVKADPPAETPKADELDGKKPERVTIASVREVIAIKEKSACRQVIADVGYSALDKVPDDKLPEVLAKIKALPNV